jgi:hypothetical protein
MTKPSQSFVIAFYFRGEDYTKLPFYNSKNFDAAYLQQIGDRLIGDFEHKFGKTENHFSDAEKKAFAKNVVSQY